jgi:hypothetical protein
MMDRLTVLELLLAALAVLVVLHFIARAVNRSRAKASVPAPVAKVAVPPANPTRPRPVETPTPPAPTVGPRQQAPAADIILPVPASNSTGTAKAETALPPIEWAGSTRPKRVVRAKAAAKAKRRPKQSEQTFGRKRLPFRPVTKADPPVSRRPKRAAQARRRKKIMAVPFMRAGKTALHEAPRAP